MHRYFIWFSYDGANYHGWQVQPNANTVQEEMTKALSLILREDVLIIGAGRTDTGVHARCMAAHFDTDARIDTVKLADKLNRLLPPDIAINKIEPVVPDAHARFSATAREYKYYVSLGKQPFGREYTYRLFKRPNVELMNKGADIIREYTDFTSFSKLHTDVKTNNCRIDLAKWEVIDEDNIVFTIRADRFLRNMVRAIVGTLLEVGMGKLSLEGLRKVIEQKDRCAAGSSVPGKALFLVDVDYPNNLFKNRTL